ncbi:MAG: hypothetical protein J6J81_04515, partial [Oscillospiraceae bacterium]|nr:hypothetical protein [Oscillospiraceae bacterium]
LDHLHVVVKTRLEADGQNLAGSLFCLAQLNSFFKGNTHRFFKQNTASCSKSGLRANFVPDKGAILQEYWAYFKKLQRMDGAKFPQNAADE